MDTLLILGQLEASPAPPGLPAIVVVLAACMGVFYLTARLTTVARRTHLTALTWAAVSLWCLTIVLLAGIATAVDTLRRTGAPFGGTELAVPRASKAVIGLLSFFGFWSWVMFCKYTFRPRDSRYWGVAGLAGGLMLTGVALLVHENTYNVVLPTLSGGLTRLVYVAGGITGFAWLGWESFSQYRILHHELADDETLDPLIVNRFLLWGIAALSVSLYFFNSLLLVPNASIAHQPQGLMIAQLIILVVSATMAYIGLAPPKWYKRRFARQGT